MKSTRKLYKIERYCLKNFTEMVHPLIFIKFFASKTYQATEYVFFTLSQKIPIHLQRKFGGKANADSMLQLLRFSVLPPFVLRSVSVPERTNDGEVTENRRRNIGERTENERRTDGKALENVPLNCKIENLMFNFNPVKCPTGHSSQDGE